MKILRSVGFHRVFARYIAAAVAVATAALYLLLYHRTHRSLAKVESSPVSPIVHNYDVPYVTLQGGDPTTTDLGSRCFYVAQLNAMSYQPDRLQMAASAKFAWSKECLLIELTIEHPLHSSSIRPKILNESEVNITFERADQAVHTYAVTIRYPGEDRQETLILDPHNRSQSSQGLDIRCTGVKSKQGYVLRLSLPVEAMGFPLREGSLIPLDINVTSSDGYRREDLQLWQSTPPSIGVNRPCLRLSRSVSPPVLALLSCRVETPPGHHLGKQSFAGGKNNQMPSSDSAAPRRDYETIHREVNAHKVCSVKVCLKSAVVGRNFFIKDENNNVVFTRPNRREISFSSEIPEPKSGVLYRELSLFSDDQLIGVAIPIDESLWKLKSDNGATIGVSFASYSFCGKLLPSPQVDNPILTRSAFGPYNLKVSYFDAKMKSVDKAGSLGRYGAIVEVQSSEGVFRSYFTLYRRATDRRPLDKNAGRLVLPRVPLEEVSVINQLAREELHTQSDLDSDYTAFEHNQKWWIRLREKLRIRFPCIVTLPSQYRLEPYKKWPVILYCHGGGAQDIVALDLNLAREPLYRVAQGKSGSPLKGSTEAKDRNLEQRPLPFIVVEPELSISDLRWTPAIIEAVLRQTSHDFRIDMDRIILSGQSIGANAAYRIAVADPHLFAGFVPLSIGSVNTMLADRLRDLPTWAFAGANDNKDEALRIVAAINAAGGSATATVLPGVGHDTSAEVWQDPKVWEWMKKLKRAPTALPPEPLRRPDSN